MCFLRTTGFSCKRLVVKVWFVIRLQEPALLISLIWRKIGIIFCSQGAWDVLRQVFSETDHKTMTIHDKMDLFFHDYSIAPLFVQENYLNVIPHAQERLLFSY